MSSGNLPAVTVLFVALQPVQRVPQFELLLEELRKTTPPTHPDYPNILKAKDLVRDSRCMNGFAVFVTAWP